MISQESIDSLVAVCILLGDGQECLDDWVHDVAVSLREDLSVNDDDQEKAISNSEAKASNINNSGMDAQIRYLLESGLSVGMVARMIAVAAWDEKPGDVAAFNDVVDLVEESLDGTLPSSFEDAEAFENWLATSLQYDALDTDEIPADLIDAKRYEALFMFLKASEIDGMLQSQLAPASKSMGM